MFVKTEKRFLETGVNKGASFYNALRVVFPEIADEIHNTKIDPFHNDEAISDAMEFLVKKLWG